MSPVTHRAIGAKFLSYRIGGDDGVETEILIQFSLVFSTIQNLTPYIVLFSLNLVFTVRAISAYNCFQMQQTFLVWKKSKLKSKMVKILSWKTQSFSTKISIIFLPKQERCRFSQLSQLKHAKINLQKLHLFYFKIIKKTP